MIKWRSIVVSTDNSYTFPVEHRDFLAEFQAVMKKYPAAAARFALADVNPDEGDQVAFRLRPPEIHCVMTEWGMICKPISPEV